MARPSKFTPEARVTILEALAKGSFREVAAKRAGIGSRTLKRWMKLGRMYPDGEYGKFAADVLRFEVTVEIAAVSRLLQAGMSEDPKLLCWYLERRWPQRYGRFRGELTELKREIRELQKMLEDQGKFPQPPEPGADGE
jgi:hypothetical protein